jgi:hypothetical protein
MFANMEGKDSTSGQRNRVCGMLHEEGDPPGSIFGAVGDFDPADTDNDYQESRRLPAWMAGTRQQGDATGYIV